MIAEDLQRAEGTNSVYGQRTGAPFQFENIAALRAFDARLAPNGVGVTVLGYYTAGDGGGGAFVYNSALGTTDNGGTIIAPASGGGRWLRTVGNRLNLKWFGAKGDYNPVTEEGTDDTDSIQSCFTAAATLYADTFFPVVIYAPAANYLHSETLTLSSNKVSIIGDGMNTSVFYSKEDFGDRIKVVGSYGGGNNVKNIGIINTGAVTSGALLTAMQLNNSAWSDIYLEGGFVGLLNQGCYTMIFDRFTVFGGSTLAGVNTTGSSFISVPTNGGAAYPAFDCLYSNFLCRSTTAESAKYVAVGIDIKQCDGLWFLNGHIIGSNFGHRIMPPATYIAQNILWDNVFFDGQCQLHLQITGAGSVFGIRYGNCVFGGADGTASADSCAINCAGLRGLSFKSCEWGSNFASALNLIAGTYIDVIGCKFTDNNASSVANVVTVSVGATRVNIMGNSFGYQPANYAIYVNGGAFLTITGNDFKQIGGVDDIFLNAVGASTQIENNTTDRSNSVASAALLPFKNVGKLFLVSGTTGISSLPVCVPNRTVQLQFAASLTVTNGANLKLAGAANFSATADDILTLTTSDGTVWREAARSVN